MNHIRKLKQLSGQSFWRYVVANKCDLKVIIDNDSTIVVNIFETDDDELGNDYAAASEPIGNCDGIFDLFSALGIEAEYC